MTVGETLATSGPVLLEVKTDPEVPPLPPHIAMQQARNFMGMLLKGDEREGSLLKETVRQVLSAILPGDKRGGDAERLKVGLQT